MTTINLVQIITIIFSMIATSVDGFNVVTLISTTNSASFAHHLSSMTFRQLRSKTSIFASEPDKQTLTDTGSVSTSREQDDDENDDADDNILDKVEMFGKGSAKVCFCFSMFF